MRSRSRLALALVSPVMLAPLPAGAGPPSVDPSTLAASMPLEIPGAPVDAPA